MEGADSGKCRSKQASNRHLTLGSVRQHASVTVSVLGILLFLSVLFPNRLVTGVYSLTLV